MGDLEWLADEPVEELEDFDVLSEGWYALTVVRAELRENKSGTGRHINIGFQTDKGRWVWNKYNVENKNPKAQKIGRAEFANLCTAAGFRGMVKDTQALIDRSLRGYVIIEEWNGRKDNRVKRHEEIPGANAGPVIMATDIPAGWGGG